MTTKPKLHDQGDRLTFDCPCGGEFVHMQQIDIDRGGHVLTIGSQLEATMGKRRPTERGTFADFTMWCEDRCGFVLRVGEHKGIVYLEIRDWRERAFDWNDEPPRELWRD